MPIWNRDWYRNWFFKGKHPPTCTCVDCTNKRLSKSDTKHSVSRKDITPIKIPKPVPVVKKDMPHKSGNKISNWVLSLLLIFALSVIGLGITLFIGNSIPFWILFGFSLIYSVEKWFTYITRKHKGIGKLYRLFLNLSILSLFGLIIWSGIRLFSQQFVHSQLVGSLVFLAEFVFFVWMWRVVSKNSWRWPGMKLTIFSLLIVSIIFAFAGVEPLKSYKDNVIAWFSSISERVEVPAAKSTTPSETKAPDNQAASLNIDEESEGEQADKAPIGDGYPEIIEIKNIEERGPFHGALIAVTLHTDQGTKPSYYYVTLQSGAENFGTIEIDWQEQTITRTLIWHIESDTPAFTEIQKGKICEEVFQVDISSSLLAIEPIPSSLPTESTPSPTPKPQDTPAPTSIPDYDAEIIDNRTGEYNNFYLGLVKAPDGVIRGNGCYSDLIVLINNKEAMNPTYAELVEFLRNDKTDAFPYQYIPAIHGFFYGAPEDRIDLSRIKDIIDSDILPEAPKVCSDFAERLHNNAELAGIRCGYISLDMIGYTDPANLGIASDAGHACNVFETVDKGTIYIDSTGTMRSDGPPNKDTIVDVEIGEPYNSQFLFPSGGWYILSGEMGIVTGIYVTWDGDWR